MSAIVEAKNLTKKFRRVTAVNDATFSLEEGGIHGLLGRNGAGKTTLMQLLTGQEFASAGQARIFGQNPVENAQALRRVCFIKESQTYPEDFDGKHVLRAAPMFFDNWDATFAARLVDVFKVPLDRKVKKLSRGQRSAIGVVVGLASRAELTFLDEPYAGLDAVARQRFYDILLADYTAHPRTIVLSTHLINEAADLLQQVVVIDEGRIVINSDADELRGTALSLAGKTADVDTFVVGREVLSRSSLGGLATATVVGLGPADRQAAAAAGLETTPVSLQDLIVSRTGGQNREEEAA